MPCSLHAIFNGLAAISISEPRQILTRWFGMRLIKYYLGYDVTGEILHTWCTLHGQKYSYTHEKYTNTNLPNLFSESNLAFWSYIVFAINVFRLVRVMPSHFQVPDEGYALFSNRAADPLVLNNSTPIPNFSVLHRNQSVPSTVGHNNVLFDGIFRKPEIERNRKFENLMNSSFIARSGP